MSVKGWGRDWNNFQQSLLENRLNNHSTCWCSGASAAPPFSLSTWPETHGYPENVHSKYFSKACVCNKILWFVAKGKVPTCPQERMPRGSWGDFFQYLFLQTHNMQKWSLQVCDFPTHLIGRWMKAKAKCAHKTRPVSCHPFSPPLPWMDLYRISMKTKN